MNKLFKIFSSFIFFFLFPVLVYAYPGQYPWDPLYLKVEDTQEKKNLDTEQRLKSQYGVSAFYNCYPCANKDTSNPYTQSSCLSQTEYCLEKQQIEQNKNNQQQTNSEWADYVCKGKYGSNSYYTKQNNSNGEYICGCKNGYKWNDNKSECIIVSSIICDLNAVYMRGPLNNNTSPPCTCPNGYIWENRESRCILNSTLNTEVNKDQQCKNFYGIYSYWTGQFNDKGQFICDCKNGYKWNDNQTNCVENVIVAGITYSSEEEIKRKTIEEEKKLISKVDSSLSKKMRGKILLQVEKNGEGWYVNPDNKKKYYLGRPADAFSIMRNLGLGIKHGELNSYINSKFPSRLSGKILLDVEQNGEAYYVNPNDLKGYFLNRPNDAFQIMRQLGLGITNNDIRKIDVGEVKYNNK